MPFKSESQRKFMWAKHPEIARRWSKEYGSKPGGKKGAPFGNKNAQGGKQHGR